MTLNLTNLEYSEKDIGANIKISKRQFVWEFDLNGSPQRIELLDSRLSKKKRLYKNGVNILNTTEEGNFIHNFEIDGHACVIIQYGDKIELRIDNQSFTHLFNLQKNKRLFAGEKGPTSNVYISKPNNSYGSSEDQNKQKTGEAIYKVPKSGENDKPKLFNFEIKQNNNKSHGFNNKFKFGDNKSNSNPINNQNNFKGNQNSNINAGKNKGNIDLLGFEAQGSNSNNANNNKNINSNKPLNFDGNNNSNSQGNQKQPNSGNDIFDLFGNNNQNNNINNNQNNNNINNNQNNNSQFNNIFLALSDGTNQQPQFDQNNLGFMDLNNNKNNNFMNNNMNINNNMTNNNINFQNKQIDQGMNQNNNSNQNPQNNGIDLLNF